MGSVSPELSLLEFQGAREILEYHVFIICFGLASDSLLLTLGPHRPALPCESCLCRAISPRAPYLLTTIGRDLFRDLLIKNRFRKIGPSRCL